MPVYVVINLLWGAKALWIYIELRLDFSMWWKRVAVTSAKNHERQRRKRQSVTAKREKSQTPKVLTAIRTLPNLT